MGRFTGRTAVVTGGGKGIGAAVAARLAEEGASVVLSDIDTDAGAATAAAIGDRTGAKVVFVRADAGSAADWRVLADTVTETFGGLDVLVHNAYFQPEAPAHDFPDELWDRALAVNVTAVHHSLRVFVPQLLTARGAMVVISSVHAVTSYAGFSAYAACKGALGALTRQLAVEYGPDLRVNAVLPGPIMTPQWEKIPPEIWAAEAERTIAGRHGTPEEVASAVAFLASADASYVTGQSLLVDGGWSVHHR